MTNDCCGLPTGGLGEGEKATTRVRLLPGDVIDRIAAGEVIERPASVLKELLENAGDAGARTIDVELGGGGLERIVVTDDGVGMGREDLELAILRHATSKLRTADDLFSLQTMGFRGEALSSIAAISRLQITSRRAADRAGTRLLVCAGEVRACGPVGAPLGTRVEVEGLFFNTPARRKFMRSPATEQTYAVEAALRGALGARKGGLVVSAGGRRLLDVSADAEGLQRIQQALGRRAGQLFAMSAGSANVEVSGFVGGPAGQRSDNRGLWLFVNGRFVRDKSLQRAILDGYRHVLAAGKFPTAVVFVDITPAKVDVNVHPQKLEVRFEDAGEVFRCLSGAVTDVVAQSPWEDPSCSGPAESGRSFVLRVQDAPARRTLAIASPHPQTSPPSSPLAMRPPPGRSQVPVFWRTLGDVFGRRIIVCDSGAALVLLDMERAWKALTLQALQAQHDSASGVAIRMLILPEPLSLSAQQCQWLEAHGATLRSYGVAIETVGPQRFALTGLPAALTGATSAEVVKAVIPSSPQDHVEPTAALRSLSHLARQPELLEPGDLVQRVVESGILDDPSHGNICAKLDAAAVAALVDGQGGHGSRRRRERREKAPGVG